MPHTNIVIAFCAGIVSLLVTVLIIKTFSNNNPVPVWAYSYGYNEQDNNWNRVRVNDKGQVICAKE